MLEDNPIVLDMNKKECEKYISDIQYNKEFAKVKTLYILIFNIGVIIYTVIRIKDVSEDCTIDILFHIIMNLGYFAEIVIATMSWTNYENTEYNSKNFERCNKFNETFLISEEIFDEAKTVSKWVNDVDEGILFLSYLFFFVFIINSIFIIKDLRISYGKCINKELFCLCIGLLSLCDECKCFSNCCEKCGKCCTCCGDDYQSLKEENKNLRKKIKELEKQNTLLRRQKNQEANDITTDRKHLSDEITMIKDKNKINLGEDSSNIEINNLRNKIRTYENDLTKLKQCYNNLTIQKTNLKK